MFKGILTDVFVCKGYEDNPALKFSGQGDTCVQFRVGEKVYDANAENKSRWVNHSVKAFGSVCERIKAMKLKEGSHVNLFGRVVEDVWTDEKTKEKKSARFLVLDDIEYVTGGGKKSENDSQSQDQKKDAPKAAEDAGKRPEDSANFDGYRPPFGGGDFFGND